MKCPTITPAACIGAGAIRHAGLITADAPANINQTIERRILVGQSLSALGVRLCIVSTFLSIAFIFLVQINYAVAPRHTKALP